MVLQERVGSSVLRLQSQEFVASLSSHETKLAELRAVLVPDVQGLLTLRREPLMFGANCGLDGELIVHFPSPFIEAGALGSPKR